MSPDGNVRRLGFEAGFFTIEPYTFSGQPQVQGTMAPTRLFYAFQPADDHPSNKPLFVIFNGGPGSSTTNVLFSFNTSARTMDTPETAQPPWKDNPTSYTRIANLLYIDTRGTGFSYNLAADGQLQSSIHLGADAADIARVIVRFLDTHEALTDNPVVIVGESYGGTRAALLLDMFLRYERLRLNDNWYVDTGLADEILLHHERAHPSLKGQSIPQSLIAQQFGWQILMEPVVLGTPQFDAQERFMPEECYSPSDAEDARISLNSSRLRQYEPTRAMLGVDPVDIRHFHASERTNALRRECEEDEATWQKALGTLPQGDCYFVPVVMVAITPVDDIITPTAYVRNLAFAKTFITNASHDCLVVPAAIPYVMQHQPQGVFDQVLLVEDPSDPHLSEIRVTFADSEFWEGSRPAPATIRFPSYDSGHCVPMYTPDRLFKDISEWPDFPGAQ